jgi:nitrate reductase gamma subunit
MQISVLQTISYFCFVVFIVKTILVWRRYAGMPRHIRWELHPTPQEEISHNLNDEKAESLRILFAESGYMFREGLLFQQCFRCNRKLWYVTYPFHLGIFSCGLWIVFLFIRVPIQILNFSSMMRGIDFLIIFLGIVGISLGIYGCAGLLIRRIFDPDLSTYTAPREYYNLCMILLVFALGMIAWLGMDRDFSLSRAYVDSLVRFSTPPQTGSFFGVIIALFSAFIDSLPFGSLQHGIAKFFTYHRVRWENEPNLRGSRLESDIISQLNRSVTWSASHIYAGKWKDLVVAEKNNREGLP